MKKIIAPAIAAVAVVALTGCGTYLREDKSIPAPPAPDGCIHLYKHETGRDSIDDEYAGVYCKAVEK